MGKWQLRRVGGWDPDNPRANPDPTLERESPVNTDGTAVRFCERLRAARRQRGYTQERLARLADVSIGTVRDLEQGRRMPWMMTAVALARALGTTVEQLLREEHNEH